MIDPTFLQILWFLLVAVLWTGYLVLEGFDLGVGMLLSILPKGDAATKEKERRVLINTIGPVWDGNEVWLLTAGGATFAAFPHWYATLFSGFYLPLLLILVALILRGVSFEYRGKVIDGKWARWCDLGIGIGSWLPAILWGVAFANLVKGVQLDEQHAYTGGFWALLSPFGLLGGLCLLSLLLMHGASYVGLKTAGDIRDRARGQAKVFALAAVVFAGGWAIWAQVAYSDKAWTWAAVLVAALAIVGTFLANNAGREGWGFFLSALTMPAAVALIFGSMYPNVMKATDPANSLTVVNASSTQYTLGVMTWVAVIMVPIVLAYTVWAYWVFRKRISVESIPAESGLSLKKIGKGAFGGPSAGAGMLDLTVAGSTGAPRG